MNEVNKAIADDINKTLRLLRSKPEEKPADPTDQPKPTGAESQSQELDPEEEGNGEDTQQENADAEEEVEEEEDNASEEEESEQEEDAAGEQVESLRKQVETLSAQLYELQTKAQAQTPPPTQEEAESVGYTEYVHLTEDDISDILTDPSKLAKVINDALNTARNETAEGVKQDFRSTVPQLVERHLTNRETIAQREKEFWTRNADLIQDMPQPVIARRRQMMASIMNELYSTNQALYNQQGYERLRDDTERELRQTILGDPKRPPQNKPTDSPKHSKKKKPKFASAQSRAARGPVSGTDAASDVEKTLTRGKGYRKL